MDRAAGAAGVAAGRPRLSADALQRLRPEGPARSLEAQLDDIQNEIRSLALRLPDGPRRAAAQDWVDLPAHTARPVEEAPRRATPPVPPPAAWPEDSRGGRSEPRLDWPRR
ncbi:hypothetical protein ACFQU2_31335 [Siccirubricoccus deserti]